MGIKNFIKNYKSKKYYKDELEIANSLNLYYRAKLDKYSSLLRKQKEQNTNPYTLLRDLNELAFSEYERRTNG